MFATAGCRTAPQIFLNMITANPGREPKNLRGVYKVLVFQGNKRTKATKDFQRDEG